MEFSDKARKLERPPEKKSLIERATAIFDSSPRPNGSAPQPGGSATAPAAESLGLRPVPPPQPAAARRSTRKQIELDFDRLQKMGYVVPGDRSSTAEEVRIIKRPLLRRAFGDDRHATGNSHLIMVTSAHPDEGKTFMAVNLALSMALEKDITVLLIDADVAKPSIPGVLGFEADLGLLDLLTDDTLDMSDVMIRTNIENLSILPAGRDRPNATELMASARMAALVKDIAERYTDRVIIFDTPPVLVRTETNVLGMHVGQVAFVVEAEETSASSIKEALEHLKGCSNVGLVMNKLSSSYGTERFGQYYSKYAPARTKR